MNVIDSDNLERERQANLRNLRNLDCAEKAAQRPTFLHPAREHDPIGQADAPFRSAHARNYWIDADPMDDAIRSDRRWPAKSEPKPFRRLKTSAISDISAWTC
jgi:hypothetical protein